MATDTAYAIADAYRWQRRLGNISIAASHCHIVTDPAHPNVWNANHADDVTAQTGAEIDSVFRAMDRHLGHTSWRVIHTDCFTPNAFLARLALDDFEERPVTIQTGDALLGPNAVGDALSETRGERQEALPPPRRRHGLYTREAIAERKAMRALIRAFREDARAALGEPDTSSGSGPSRGGP